MNKIAKKMVILGAVIIIILFAVLYFGSKKVLNEIEYKINNGMESARLQIENTKNNEYGIKRLEYTPFKCSGIINYRCKSDSISIYMDDKINNKIHESIKFTNLAIEGEAIKSKDSLSLKIETDISYPEVNNFFGDSKQDALIAFFNKGINAILPNKLLCSQDYLYTQNENIKQNNISAYTKCNIESQVFTTNLETKNLFEVGIDKPHILGILYEITMAMSGNSTNNQIKTQNIPHELSLARISLTKKQTFDNFLMKQNEISGEQKNNLKSNFESYIKLMQLIGTPFLKSYLGQNGAIIMQGLVDLMRDKIKHFGVEINLKDSQNLKPLNIFTNMNIIEWMNYINKNYNIKIFINQKEIEENKTNIKMLPETDELYETINQNELDDTSPQIDDETLHQDDNDNLDNELLEPPSLLES